MGQSPFQWRSYICIAVSAVLPVSVSAEDHPAMLRSSSGAVLLNRNPAPASSALFPDDSIETQKDSLARIEASGSAADINPETILEFEGNELVLEHGSISVNTSHRMRVRVGCLIVEPVDDDWTHYEVVDVDGKVNVSALKRDVNINERSKNLERVSKSGHSDRVTVREGQRKTRDDKCAAAEPQSHGPIAAAAPILNSIQAKLLGGGAIAALTCWALCRGDDPVSPKDP